MLSFVKFLIDWSEVWALLIPLFFYKKQPALYKPVVFYIWIAFFINLLIDVIWKIRNAIPTPFNSNNYLYNLHSVIRFYLFSLFFLQLKQPYMVKLKKALPLLFTLFLIVNFGFFENFFNYRQFSNKLLCLEAFLLLFYTLLYYFFKINEDMETDVYTPDFWIVTGLGIYTTFSFFIFLLYNELPTHFKSIIFNLWTADNISFIIFNIFLAKALHASRKQ